MGLGAFEPGSRVDTLGLMRASSLAAVRELTARLGGLQRVDPAPMPPARWGFDDDGALRHEQTDFFNIVGVEAADGRRGILMRQAETALVGLVVTRVDGVLHALCMARCEPGLHGSCQLSTTVQSTPSNYLQRHDGAPTPHLDLVLTPPASATVLHDSLQFDWGQFYLGKTKRFVVVELAEPIEALEPSMWIAEPDLVSLLTADFAVTSDLRAALALVLAHGRVGAADLADLTALDSARSVDVHADALALCDVRTVSGWDAAIAGPVAVRSVSTSSPSREVTVWQQPLVEVGEVVKARLPVMSGARTVDGQPRYGIRARTKLGLRGLELWYPDGDVVPEVDDGSRVIRTSAEGGRFWRLEVDVALTTAVEPASSPGVRWVTATELAALCSRAQCASVELRLALSLVMADLAGGAR